MKKFLKTIVVYLKICLFYQINPELPWVVQRNSVRSCFALVSEVWYVGVETLMWSDVATLSFMPLLGSRMELWLFLLSLRSCGSSSQPGHAVNLVLLFRKPFPPDPLEKRRGGQLSCVLAQKNEQDELISSPFCFSLQKIQPIVT